jgi:internalin A
MRDTGWIIVVAVALGGMGQAAADDAEDKAVAAVEKLGGMVVRDAAKPGKPVTEVSLPGARVTDADLKQLAPFKGLTRLNLHNTGVTGTGFKDLAPLKGLTWISLTSSSSGDWSTSVSAGPG